MNIVVESTIIPAKQISKRSIQMLTENNLSVDSIHTNGTYKVSIRERNLNIPVEPSKQSNFRTNKLEVKNVKLNCNGSNDHSASIAINSHQIKAIGNIRCSIWTLGRISCVFSLDLIGKFAQVRILDAHSHSLRGELVISEVDGVAPFGSVVVQ